MSKTQKVSFETTSRSAPAGAFSLQLRPFQCWCCPYVRGLAAALAALILAVQTRAEDLQLSLASPQLVQARLERGSVSAEQRQTVITRMFMEPGCSVQEQRLDKKSGNVICTLPGQTASEIIVGGHFDFAERGKGIVDDWSGASLLVSLYQALSSRTHRHTYTFVAFAGEERGLRGSTLFVKKLAPERKATVRAFVNLECLGLTPIKIWTHRSAPDLVSRLMEVASAVGITPYGVNVDNVGNDDTYPFALAKMPVISLHSVTQDTLSILHSERDQMNAVHLDEYYSTYKLVAFYLAYLDLKLE
jgi:Peptidase family M28